MNFSVKHMMISKVHGSIDKLTGTFAYDQGNLKNSRVEVGLEADSVSTREALRDIYLKSADFFDVTTYPLLSFCSTSFERSRVTGDLTIRGITKSVVLEIEELGPEKKNPRGTISLRVRGKTKIKRKDFGLTWNVALEAGGFLVGDDISISFDVQLNRRPL